MDIAMGIVVLGGGYILWQSGALNNILQGLIPQAQQPAAAAPEPAAAEQPAPAAAADSGCHGGCKAKNGQICCLATTPNELESFEALFIDDSYDQYFTGASSKNKDKNKKSKAQVACAADKPTAMSMTCNSAGQPGGFLNADFPDIGGLEPTSPVSKEIDDFLNSTPETGKFSDYPNAPEVMALRDPKATGKSSDRTNKRGNYSIDHYVKKQQNFNKTGFGTLGGLSEIYGEDGAFYGVNVSI